MTDPIADMLTRIRNAYAVKKDTVNVPYSKVKETIIKVLVEKGYCLGYEVSKDTTFKELIVTLKYVNNLPVITKLQRISKPGRRVYTTSKDIKTVLAGYGLSIISTNEGMLSGEEAKTKKLGGEVICKLW